VTIRPRVRARGFLRLEQRRRARTSPRSV